MSRAFHRLALAVICGVLALAPGVSAWVQGASSPGSKVIYNLYATDGYARLDDGSVLHIYGFIGGREGEPLTYLDENGDPRTLAQGSPAPAAGAVTEAEAVLAGHAQLVAPLIWASSEDVVELRLKNLGGMTAGSPASPLGIEFRGLDAGGYDEGALETSVLAIPANAQLPNSGNLLSYTFRISNPGTYAYGWSYSSHLGHEGQSYTQAASTQAALMGCPCRAMHRGMSSGSMEMGGPDPIYSALDGALVVYNATDPAAQTGPGMGAGGAILGLHFDQDFVMLLTGAQDAPMDMSGMTGMATTPQSHSFLVNGSLPGTLSRDATGISTSARNERQIQPNHRPFVPQPGLGAQRILVRILNLSGQPQPAAAVTQGYRSIAYQAHQLAWANAAVAGASWAEGSEAGSRSDPGYPVVQPGESLDVMLDLDAPRPAGPGLLAAVQFNTTGGTAAIVSSSSLSAVTVPGGMTISLAMSQTMPGSARQCLMTVAQDENSGASQAATCMMTGRSSLWMK